MKNTRILSTILLMVTFISNVLGQNNQKVVEKKVDIGGYSIYTKVSGEGGPTVIFESGGGGSSREWKYVQPEIAKITRTFSYDRPGIGKSDESPLPRTASEQVKELRLILEKANIKPPYIFVPNSYGAFISNLFAYQYPNEVAGIVYVDGTNEKLPTYVKDYLSFFKFQMYKLSTRKFPDGNYKELCESQLEITKAAKSDRLRNTPIVVLTSDIRLMAKQYSFLMTVENSPWLVWQKEMASLSNKSKHYIVYGSGHMIHLEKPKLVVDAITKLVENKYKWYKEPETKEPISSLSEDKMNKFIGRYYLDTDDVLSIAKEDGHFYITSSLMNKAELYPISENKLTVEKDPFSFQLISQNGIEQLEISGKYLMESIMVRKVNENYRTPYENLMQGKINEAISEYNLTHKQDPLNKAISETRFNTIGYDFLFKDKLPEAIAIFKLNTEFHPNSSNAFDSLAEAYLKAEKNELAIENYKKSLELNPNNRNAENVLKKLGVDL